jgi:hypothetical protein
MSRLPTTACMITACGTALLLSACSADRPTAPSSKPDDEAVGLAPNLSAGSDDDDDGRGWLQLLSINGPGRGRIRATRMDDRETGNFVAHIEIEVRRAPPNTTYLIQRAPEVNPPNADGSCTRGLGMGPWSPSFVTFQGQTLTTDRRGRGELEFRFAPGVAVPAFDVMFRLMPPGDAAESVFLSECTTLRP